MGVGFVEVGDQNSHELEGGEIYPAGLSPAFFESCGVGEGEECGGIDVKVGCCGGVGRGESEFPCFYNLATGEGIHDGVAP